MEPTVPRPIDGPAPTLTGKSGQQCVIRPEWPHERPATAVCGDPRVSPPGFRGGRAQYEADPEYAVRGDDSIRVTVAEGGVLQSFPADYPWRGSKSKQFEQVGNACPPLLSLHALSAITGLSLPVDVAA